MRRSWVMTGLMFAAAAIVLRAAWILYCWHARGAALEFDDEHLHWQIATNLVQHGQFVSDDGLRAPRMPLYPLFLAAFAGAGSYGVLIARIAQALLGGATTLVAYRFARSALGERAALLAGLLVCIDPYAVFFANLLLSEVLFTFIAVCVTACAWGVVWGRRNANAGVRSFAGKGDAERESMPASVTLPRPLPNREGGNLGRPRGWVGDIVLALLGPAAVLTRPESLGWVGLLWIVLLLGNSNRARATLRLVVCVATFGVLMIPWGLRNHAVLGSFAWLSTNGGVTLYDAQGPQADGSSNQAFLRAMPELAGLGEVQRDARLHQLAIQQMQRDPARVARLAVVKFLRTWNFIPNVREYHGGFAALASAAFTVPVLVLAGVGLWRTRKSPTAWFHVLIWLPVVYFTLVSCVYIGSLRYRVPLMPFVELAAAAAVVNVARRPQS